MITLLDIDSRFACQVSKTPLGERVYRVRFRWCQRTEAWYFDLETPGGTVLLSGVRLGVGYNLLSQYAYDPDTLPDGWLLCFAVAGSDIYDPPGRTGLGITHKVAYISADHVWT